MPIFDVIVTRDVTESFTTRVVAADADAAQENARSEKLTELADWQRDDGNYHRPYTNGAEEVEHDAAALETAYYDAAKNIHSRDGECEIDSNATVSISEDGGAYVQAWVWVYDDDAGICRECREPNADNGDGFDGMCGDCADRAEEDSE